MHEQSINTERTDQALIAAVPFSGAEHRGIRKRDGTLIPFDQERITRAVSKAMLAVETPDCDEAERCSEEVCRLILERFHPGVIPGVEQIQDIVEEVLIARNHAKAAKAYILYRDQHSRLRESKSLLNDIQQIMAGYLEQSDWRARENSNVNYSLGGLILHNSGTVTANDWLNSIYSPEVANAHRRGEMHIHDLGMFSGYCAGWSLKQLLQLGLGGVPEDQTEREAQIRGLVGEMIEVLQDPQSTSYYAFLARRILEAYESPELIFRALSETKDEARMGKIRRSKGAFFVHLIKRYSAENGVSLKPKSPARP